MKDKLIANGVLLSVGINIVILICIYFLEYRVGLLESVHGNEICHKEPR